MEIILTISSGVAIALLVAFLQQLPELHRLRQSLSTAEDELTKAKSQIKDEREEHAKSFETFKAEREREAEKKEEYISDLRGHLFTCKIVYHANHIHPSPENLFDHAKAKE